MNDRISHILAQMAALEDELRTAVHDQESRMFFQINGKRSSSSARSGLRIGGSRRASSAGS